MTDRTPAYEIQDVPRPYPTGAEFGGRARFWLFAVLAILVEGAAVWLVLAGHPVAALGLHALLCLLLWLLAARALRHGNGVRLRCLLAISVTALGPLGAIGMMLGTATLEWTRRTATPFADWYSSIFPVEERSLSQQLYEAIRGGKEDDALATAVGSFIDVMHNGTSRQKQIVIALISRNYRPSFAPALLEALNDSDPSVRVQAASATAFVEQSLSQRLVELSRAVEVAPDDPDAQLALARHLDLYAISGLADDDRSADLRRQAAGRYRTALAARPEDAELRLEFGRLLVRLDEPEEAAAVFAALKETPAGSDLLHAGIAPWYAESLFRTGRLDELRVFSEEAQAYGARIGLPDRPRVRFWARQPDAGGSLRERADRQRFEQDRAAVAAAVGS
ncbi:MAG: hypothetical protein RIB84_15930 [Sneathiellaceae bacterium]